ncbi:DUF4279 domain-containing protein [Streptomyces adustus]|uniref:DUF4279 domain-containing protein n=1 Tax=Streptomyces adustus TaxID=1609272 RepID=UPI003716FFCA
MQPAAPVTKWSAGSIRITSRTVTVGEISGRLGSPADQQFERDSLMSPRNPTSVRRETSVWLRRSGLPDDSDLTDRVRVLVALVDGHREELASLSADCDLELRLGFGSENGQGGCVLPVDLRPVGTDEDGVNDALRQSNPKGTVQRVVFIGRDYVVDHEV